MGGMGGGGDVWMVVWVGESGVMDAKPFWVEWGYTATLCIRLQRIFLKTSVTNIAVYYLFEATEIKETEKLVQTL